MKPLLCLMGFHHYRAWAVNVRKAIVTSTLGGFFDCCDRCGKVVDDTKHWSNEPTEAIPGRTK